MNKATNITLEQAADFLKENDDFLILSHANPDGDTFGCSHGLCGALQRIGKRARIECADPMSSRLLFMKEAIEEQDFEPKAIITVDVADKELLGKLEEKYGDRVDLAIDHHLSHVPFAKRIYVEDNAAAACEIIYDLVLLLGTEIDPALARCIYAGIATDTGCFKFGNTTPSTHIKAGKLMEYGFDCAALNYRLFDMKSKARIALEQKVIEGMEYFAEGRGAVVILSKSLLDSVDAEDINGISAIPRQIEGVEVGIVLKEKENGWKASMRSNNVNVQELCGLFGGGGHIRAAGCSFKNQTPEEIKEKIKAAVTRAIEAL
ncbi:MAG: bifunctional oligoribonuclease/PAP phosphatase NrnA [Firmicutes bacterium]|nr:bifunctional oligoribonuclease/PAP phosphatase NrnA [[Eubacterium] siraeum]MCM1488214.1 bifunctional oligoribonuclease/PAP phosphatase NrnA [Bacillota bacterium]